MEAREAARQAIAESGYETANFEKWPAEDLEEITLRAFALAGYGWRPIEEARKDGKGYFVSAPEQKRGFVSWFEAGMWVYVGGHGLDRLPFEPTMFHELPQPPINHVKL